MKKTALVAAVMGTSILLGACTGADDKQPDDQKKQEETTTEKQEKQEKQEIQENQGIDKSDTAKSDKELQEEFAKEEGVSNVNLIVTEDSGGYVLVDFQVNDTIKKEDADKLATAFLKKAEEAYPDYNIDIQARKNGETIAQQTKEK
ncbi:PBP1b-binding outer membrane lipoprotein LpoB [Sporosarcina luteola]|nr:PBP1b-binding outer membrane lipoprotein LpoB [Sporosarcina luteola]